MRKIRILNFFAILLFLLSCSRNTEELQSENETLLSKKTAVAGKSSLVDLPVVYAVIYSDYTCTNGKSYKYYATATDVVPYDRHVYSIAKRGDATIILPLRIIPANENVSTSIGVFLNETVKVGDVSVQAQQVFNNTISTDVSSEFDRPFIDMYVDNCIRTTISPPGNPCNTDSNDNGIPDCFE